MARPELNERFRRSKLHRYLLDDENVILAQRQHWAACAVPVGSGVMGFFVVVALTHVLPPSILTDLLWWAMLAVTAWAASRWYQWRRNWLVATDKRVMVNYGVLHQGVAMFSLSRVPDLTYTRSSIGQLLGYGKLERESTGTHQTLHEVNFVEHPHATYTTICAAIFNLQDRILRLEEDEVDKRIDNIPPGHTPGLHAQHVPPEERVVPTAARDKSDDRDYSTGIQVHYGASRHINRRSSHESTDLRESSLRDDSMGPIYRRPATDAGDWQPTTNDPDRDKDHETDAD